MHWSLHRPWTAALNALVESVFGSKLVTREETVSGWPEVWDMRGRVVVVLSGGEINRLRYLRDPGENPSVAMNDAGQVIELHDSGSGSLWYWTGQMQSDGTVRWYRHGRFDTGQDPAVAIDNDGWVVEVHQAHSAETLWYRIGRMESDYEMSWSTSTKFDDGLRPSIRFDSLDGDELREIHKSEDNNQLWYWDVLLDRSTAKLEFGDHDKTSGPRWDEDTSVSNAGSVQVWSGNDGGTPNDTLLYSTDQVSSERIRYEQLLFMDYQQGNLDELLEGDVWFFTIKNGDADTASAWQDAGWSTRIWAFDEEDASASGTPPSFPATDTPQASWYDSYCQDQGALE